MIWGVWLFSLLADLVLWFQWCLAFVFVIWFNSWAYFLWYGYSFSCSGLIGFLTLCLVAEKTEEKRRKVKELNWGKNLTIWLVWFCDVSRMKKDRNVNIILLASLLSVWLLRKLRKIVGKSKNWIESLVWVVWLCMYVKWKGE